MYFGDGSLYRTDFGHTNEFNIQARTAIEATTMGFTGGISVTQIFGRYINYRYFMDAIIAEMPYFDKPMTVLGGFLGYKAKSGSSLGVTANFFNGKSDMTFQGQKTTAQVSEYTLGLSFSHVF